jgi:aspartokinase
MAKIRLGGIKIFEGRSHLSGAQPPGVDALGDISARLAANQINLNWLTYVDNNGAGAESVSLCTDPADGFTSYFHMKVRAGEGNVVRVQAEVNLLSVFPHDQKPVVAGKLLELLGQAAVHPQGLASSPSAMSFLVTARETARVIDGLFEMFAFPAYPSPMDWHAAYQGREQVLKEIVCSYREEVIKLYTVVQQAEMDLWNLAVDPGQLAGLGQALGALEPSGTRLPFLVMHAETDQRLILAFCFAAAARQMIAAALDEYLPEVRPYCLRSVGAFFLHGPHFGDRFGIANTLLGALQNEGVAPLALSCTVSSISVIVRAAELEGALASLRGPFEIP